jgi:amino acid transporter
MNETPPNTPIGQLHRALGIKDLILLNIVSIVSLSTLSQIAQLGFSSITLLLLCTFTFLIPSGLTVAELNARMPEEGGFYLWTRKAFGEFHGYVAAWSYWLSNVVWLSTVLMLISVPALYLFGNQYLYLADNSWYTGVFGIGMIWLVTIMNIFGIERAKWIQNIGGTATWMCILLLAAAGIYYAIHHESLNRITMASLIPEIWNSELLPYIALVPFCFGGLELAPVMAGEIKNPGRDLPRAIWYASAAVAIIYILGSGTLVYVIPDGQIGVIEGVAQTFHVISSGINLKALGIIGVLLAVLSPLGLFGAWMTGNARIPFVIGIDHYLPEGFAKVHYKYGSPYVSLIIQAVTITFLFLVSNAGSSIKEAFMVLLEMSVILYFIPFLYLFASFARHAVNQHTRPGMFKLFSKSKLSVWVIAFFGFSTTLVATFFSCVPPKETSNTTFYLVKVVGGAIVLIGLGLIVYFRKMNNNSS